jgi:hypothetical protein
MKQTITLEQIGKNLGVTKECVSLRIRNFWKDKFPPVCGMDGKTYLYDKVLVEECLKKYPYTPRPGGARYGNNNRIKNKGDDFAPKQYTINKDYLNWLCGNNYVQTT